MADQWTSSNNSHNHDRIDCLESYNWVVSYFWYLVELQQLVDLSIGQQKKQLFW